MDQYQIGDISSLLNSAASKAASSTTSLFGTASAVAISDVYAVPKSLDKPHNIGKQGKRPKKDKVAKPETEKPEELKFPKLSPDEQLALDRRTLFVGNLPIKLKRKQFRKMFAEFGEIETLRFRSVAISDPKLGRQVCLKSNKINENATTKNGYIVFKSDENLEKACSKNGSVVGDLHIRVDKVVKSKKEISNDSKNSVFIGNIPFAATEEDIRNALADCGEIEYVRILRDKETNIGKGFGYVKFVDDSGVMFAMTIKDTVEINGRKLRIQKCKSKETLANKKTAKDAKSKVQKRRSDGTAQTGAFRGRKSKDTDKELFSDKKKRTRPAKKKFEPHQRSAKKTTMTKKKFDKKVNKTSKKGQERTKKK